MSEPISYKIATEVPPSYIEKLVSFIYTQYLLPQKERFAYLSREATENGTLLSYVTLDKQGKPLVQVQIRGATPLEVTLTPAATSVPTAAFDEARQDIVIAVQFFEERVRKTTLYFAWREGENIVPETVKKQEKSFQRLFLETQILFFIIFIIFGMALFTVISTLFPEAFWIAPILLIAIQFVLVFHSSKFIARTADWHITETNPIIQFLEYRLPSSIHDGFTPTFSSDQLVAIKKEIYEEILAKRGEIDCEAAQKVFAKHGITCDPENLATKKVNVYALVKRTADKFGFSIPNIVVSNTMVPNAAAAGPSPSRGIVLLTTGILVQLEEEEVVSVLGHEFGHLKGRDPLILYGLTASEFLFRFYVLFPLFPFIFSSFLFLIYFWAVMTGIFFIAKFFEARADLVSAIKMGQPEVLATALEKIGFQRLLYERTPSFRLQGWLGLDAHPPISFRVNRLNKLETPVKTRHPLIQSIRDVLSGFIKSL
ncbi:MAG: M56 family metallopeptidase [Candidatus Bathyarchaeota archaeon]|nr:M56 family metallopeptidase [Candidatus Bathyarchaeota archaeon]